MRRSRCSADVWHIHKDYRLNFMKDSTKRQVWNGLRWGGGLAVFLVAILPLVDGLRRTIWAAHAHQPIEPIGWMELVVAAALFASTANVWVYYLLGCMVFGGIKGIALLAMGGGGPPLQTSALLLCILVAILLLSEHRSKTHNIP